MAAAAAAGAAANTVVTTSSTSLSLAVSSPLSIGFVADLLGAPADPPRHRAAVDAASVSGEPPLMGALRAGHWAAAAALVDVDAAVFSRRRPWFGSTPPRLLTPTQDRRRRRG